MAYPVTKKFRAQLNSAVLEAYEAKLEQMAEPRKHRAGLHLRTAQSRKRGRRADKSGKTGKGQSPAVDRNGNFGPCWPEAERRRNPCHENGPGYDAGLLL